jgi:hypothetical protein
VGVPLGLLTELAGDPRRFFPLAFIDVLLKFELAYPGAGIWNTEA